MKNFSKKLLSLFSVGMLLLSNGTGFVNYRAAAVKPLISQDECLGENEFLGDDGRRYLLGDFVDRGNQVVVYDCFCKDDKENYVVKISLEDLESRQASCNEDERGTVLEILKMPPEKRCSEFQGEITIELKGPPPAPHKDPTAFRRVDKLMPKIRIDFDDSDSEDESGVDADEFFAGDSSDETGFDIDAFCDGNSGEESESDDDKFFIEHSARNRLSKLDACSSDDTEELFRSKDTNSEERSGNDAILFKMSKPGICFSRTHVINPSLANILAQRPIRSLVPIASFVPYVERKFPYSLKQCLSGAYSLPKTEAQFLDWSANIFDSILCSLIDLHGLEICHRDVKSDNVFLNSNGDVFLGDLGSACFFNTAASKRVGTPRCMAPEVFRMLTVPINPKICGKSDVFSLGITALEVLTSDFKAIESIPESTDLEDYYEDRNKTIVNKIDTFHLRVGGRLIPERWKNFLKACLDPNPVTRASAETAKELLKEAVATMPSKVVQ